MYRHPELLQKEFPIDAKVIQLAIMQSLLDDEDSRDVRPLQSLLSRALATTPKMTSHEKRRAAYVSSATWDIVPSDGYEDDDKAAQLAENAKKRLSSFIKHYPKRFVKGDLFGVSMQELEWIPKSIGLVPNIKYNFNPTELEVNNNYNYGVVWLKPIKDGRFQRQEINENERHNHLIYIPEFEEPGGILRTIIYEAFMINLSRQEWTRYIQLLKGIIHTKVEVSASAEDKEAAVEATEGVVESQAAVTSSEIEMDWRQLTSGDSGKSFREFLEACFELIEVAITNVTMSATNKERNALTVIERSAEDLAKEMRAEFEELMNNQLLKHDYYMNVDKSEYGKELPYEFRTSVKIKQDRQANADILFELIDRGIPIKASEFEEKVGVSLAVDSDEILTSDYANQLKNQLNIGADETEGDDTKD